MLAKGMGKASFVLFCGRIRRLGFEAALALLMLAYLSVNKHDLVTVDVVIVLVASAFLYDICQFADFQEPHFSMSQIKSLINEDD